MKHTATWLLILCACLFGCGDCDPENQTPGENNTSTALCSTLTPARLSGQPLDELLLATKPMTPMERDNLWMEYEVDSTWYPAVIEGGLEPIMIVPVHPDGIQGGALNIRFIDGLADSTCGGEESKPIELTIEAIPAAPGELKRYSTAYLGLMDTFLEAQGLSRETLLEGPIEDVPIHVMPLLAGWGALADPENPNSLQAIIEPDGPWADLDGFSKDLELVEALFAKAGVVEALENSATQMAAYERTTPATFERVTVTPTEVNLSALTAASLFRAEINDIGQLSDWMKFARKADAMELAANKVNTIATYLGVVPVFSAGANIAGLATAVLAQMSKALLELLPQTLRGLTLEGSPESYLEDQERAGRIMTYTIVAESGRWKFSQAIIETIIEIIFFKLDSARRAGDEVRSAANEAAEQTFRTRAKNAAGDGLSSLAETEVTNRVKGKIKALYDALTSAEIGPFRWGPFDLAGTTTMVLEREGNSIAVNDTAGGYESIAVGTSTLTAYAKATEFPPFSNEESSRLTMQVDVSAIAVAIDPVAKLVVPGEVVMLRGVVSNAVDDRLAWYSGRGFVKASADTETATVTIPMDAQEGEVIVVTATSNSNGGLRTGEFRKEEREGTATFFLKERVALSPNYRCVSPGSNVSIDATVIAGPDANQLDWDASGGALNVSPNTLAASYTAPTATGLYEINARLRSNPDVADSAFVRVGSCQCYFEGYVAGIGGFGGPNVGRISVGGAETFTGDWPDLATPEGFLATSAEGAGQYALIITLPSGQVFVSESATMTGRTMSDGFVEGTLEGSVQSTMDAGMPPTLYPAQVRFRGIIDPEFGGECIDFDE